MQNVKSETATAKDKIKPEHCKHAFKFDASFLTKGPTKGICTKCGHEQIFGAAS